MSAEKKAVTLAVWVLLLSGFYGIATCFMWYFEGRPIAEYMPAGLAAGAYLFSGVLASFIKSRIK